MATPNWFKPLAWAALIWNLLGVIAFVMQMMITPEMISQLPQAQQQVYVNIPLWSTVVFATAVFTGLIGALLLLAKKAVAQLFFVLSLIAVFAQQYYNFVVIDSITLFGFSALFMPLLVIIINIILIMVSQKGRTESWLH